MIHSWIPSIALSSTTWLSTGGNPDYPVRIAVKDLEAAEHFISQVLTAIEGVERVSSHITMKVLKAPL